jgi:G:T/U-mismatch repair DNA glycosylase
MMLSQDEIETFIPKVPRVLILGTMAAVCARTIDGKVPDGAFYYHDSRNQFWKIVQFVFAPEGDPKKMRIDEKQEFLEKHGIAMANLVGRLHVERGKANSASDRILFEAHKNGSLEFKAASPALKNLFKTKPVFFTCSSNREITNLLHGYLEYNGLSLKLDETVCFLKTPTRCNPRKRSNEWRQKFELHANLPKLATQSDLS